MKGARLAARIADTAKALRLICCAFTVACALAGMDWRDVEARSVIAMLALSSLGVAGCLLQTGVPPDYLTALRHASFNLVSLATDSGSTGGGIKMIRTITLAKQGHLELMRMIHPAIINPVRIGNLQLPVSVIQAMLGFIFLYFMTVVTATFLLMAPGLGDVVSNYAGLTDFQKWVCVATMLTGRLEVLSVLVLFTPGFWRR